jgi:superfamily II DNA/RNA helicase
MIGLFFYMITTEIQPSFSALGLSAPLVDALAKQGITAPFPIQAATLPDALAGHDVLGRGQTGSGKTLAFGLALLNNLNGKKAKPKKPLALVLAPTRELAQQINEVLSPLARAVGQKTVVIAGGMGFGNQITALKNSTSILVATPGRLMDLMQRGDVRLDELEIVVLDEADQMADMGFLPAVRQILSAAKPGGQRFLFSATLDRGVDGLVRQFLKDPRTHTVEEIEGTKERSDHYVLVMSPTDKGDISNQIASREGKSIFFVRTKHGADRLAKKLSSVGVNVGALHGGKTQAVRTKTLADFKASDSAVLVATDVAARGIHVDGIDLVVHFDAPADHKDYLHRSGRTARAGSSGRVVTLATHQQQREINGIMLRAGIENWVMAVKPMDEKLVQITGARKPTGIPTRVERAEPASRPSARPSQKRRTGNGENRNRKRSYGSDTSTGSRRSSGGSKPGRDRGGQRARRSR